jgi:molecular chaperone DnaK
MPLADWSGRGRKLRKLRNEAAKLPAALAATPPDGRGLDQAARQYGRLVRDALALDPGLAAQLFAEYDDRIPARSYALAFGPPDETWLAGLAATTDQQVLTVVYGLATRLGLERPRRQAQAALADLLGQRGDAAGLAAQFRHWQGLGVLDATTLDRALRRHVARAGLAADAPLWSSFFAQLPEAMLPALFEVHCFLGRGTDAVALADSPARQRAALDCCANSPRRADALAGLELARRLEDPAAVARLAGHAADLLFAARQYAEALELYWEAGQAARQSECHELLGQLADALATCPADQPDRLARLAGLGQPAVDELVDRQELTAALTRARELLAELDRAAPVTDAVQARRVELTGLRDAILATGRARFATLVREARPADRAAASAAWSRFEEQGGDLSAAAQRAEDAGELYRAHRLYRQAERFGEADRVLQGEQTADGLASRASAREAGGDLIGAARLYEEAGQPAEALQRYERAGDLSAATRCLLDWRGLAALADARLAGWLRATGGVEELIGLCLRAARDPEHGDRAGQELLRLQDEGAIPAALEPEVDSALAALNIAPRRGFDERAQGWVAQARAEVDRRFARIWGLDLGTTTCSVAIYDTREKQPVLCPWKGATQFASTLSLDARGNELVGLSGEELLASWLTGHVSAAKRAIGTGRQYRLGQRSYRSEDVAARMIRHARGMVESFLAGRVRERVGELARAELGEVRQDWLRRAEQEHDLRLDRPRAIVTIPAYFTNNQKQGTRDACQIAEAELVRMIHEPTAACVAAARERHLTGRIVVVDLGAGTLDISFLEADENAYDVLKVTGDNKFGGRDFDDRVAAALASKLVAQGIQVPRDDVAARRMEIAAEHLKVSLSAQTQASYTLLGFADRASVQLELSRAELAQILAEPLARLGQICAGLADSLPEPPDHLVLVGGPMLSPLVTEVIEGVFGLRRTQVPDPRAAVARGAALQAAMLDGRLEAPVLLDVTPLPLGIRSVAEGDREHRVFSMIIDKNTRKQEIYTTVEDSQTAVDIEIFNGELDDELKIGEFRLDGIAPAPAGTPQIEVTFSIDTSCVLTVRALDKGTGRSRSIVVTDTTLLSPAERDEMTRRYQLQRERERVRQRVAELIDEAGLDDGAASWREFRGRLDAHRPTGGPLLAQDEEQLLEMYREASSVEVELALVQGPLRDLAATARAYLDRPEQPDDLEQGRHLERELSQRLDRLARLLARLAGWNALLVRLALSGGDPLGRFRERYQAGEHTAALRALAELAAGPELAAEDLQRQLHCLAETGDAVRYRDVLVAGAGLLGVAIPDPERLSAFSELLGPALVRVGVALAGGGRAEGTGFLVSDRLVVTSAHLLAGTERGAAVDADQVEAALAGGRAEVDRIFLPRSAHTDLALLRLSEPASAPPLRLGYPDLVRIGDRVRAAAPGADGGPAVLAGGLVDRFERFPEQDLRLFRTGLRLEPRCSGAPLLNELGEVVGVLAIRDGAAGQGAFAVTADALGPLLSQAGFARHPA